MKLKRVLAIIIDWNISGIPAILYSILVLFLVEKFPQLSIYSMILFPLFVISLPLFFVYRDVIFKGQSLAKRIFKIEPLDLTTNALPTKNKLIKRNIFFFILPIEIILIILKNQTLGDMITNTTEIQQKHMEKL